MSWIWLWSNIIICPVTSFCTSWLTLGKNSGLNTYTPGYFVFSDLDTSKGQVSGWDFGDQRPAAGTVVMLGSTERFIVPLLLHIRWALHGRAESMDDTSLIRGREGNWGPERWSDLPTLTFWAQSQVLHPGSFIPVILPRSVACSRADNAEENLLRNRTAYFPSTGMAVLQRISACIIYITYLGLIVFG